jgi:hypothetical protein
MPMNLSPTFGWLTTSLKLLHAAPTPTTSSPTLGRPITLLMKLEWHWARIDGSGSVKFLGEIGECFRARFILPGCFGDMNVPGFNTFDSVIYCVARVGMIRSTLLL